MLLLRWLLLLWRLTLLVLLQLLRAEEVGIVAHRVHAAHRAHLLLLCLLLLSLRLKVRVLLHQAETAETAIHVGGCVVTKRWHCWCLTVLAGNAAARRSTASGRSAGARRLRR